MITREVIDTLYKKYQDTPESADCLNMSLLFDDAATHHKLAVDVETERLTIGSVAKSSPFRRIAMRCINAIVPFEEWIAIVMHSSIIFLNRDSSDVSVHLRPFECSFMDRIRTACAIM
jgi:hypothetical protein